VREKNERKMMKTRRERWKQLRGNKNLKKVRKLALLQIKDGEKE
jgi:hypothetical protein